MDWDSLDNYAYLNPRLPALDATRLRSLLEAVSEQFRAHVFLLSSGTTGGAGQDLKWVALSKAALLTSAMEVNRHLGSDTGIVHSELNNKDSKNKNSKKNKSKDVWLHVLPDFHVGGLGIRARAHLSGAKVVRLAHWDPREFVTQVSNHSATLASLVPAQVYDLVHDGWRSPVSLRAVLVGGGALAPSLRLKACQLGWPLLITYGMTEASSQIATSPRSTWNSSRESLGSVSNSVSISVSGDSESCNASGSSESTELELLPHWAARAGADGKIQIRGDSLFTAYVYSGPRGEPVVWAPLEDGWFTPQDRVTLRGRTLQILGRTQDFIKIGGESVDLGRLQLVLENIRLELDLVSDLALIAAPDARLGHVVHLVSDQSLTQEAGSGVLEIFNQRVVAFERIRKWTQLVSLPRTSLGKLILTR